MGTLTIELESVLSAETLERLQSEAANQGAELSAIVREAIETYLEDLEADEEFEDTPDEKIVEDFRQAWHEAMTGQTRPAREALDEIHRSLGLHDDES